MANETVLITGASSGIGLELARLFAADDSNLVLVARREERLRALADELKSEFGVDVFILPKDLSEENAPREIFDWLQKEGIQIDVVVNNAGFGSRGKFAELGEKAQMDMIRVNVAALTHLTRLFLPGIIERGRGGILNVGSLAGFQPGPNLAVYYATKAYVLSFTEAMRRELAPQGVRVNSIIPGPIAGTEGMDRLAPTDAARKAASEGTPLRRFGSTHEVGHAALFLASPLAAYVTGAVLPVDGGTILMGARGMGTAIDQAFQAAKKA